MAKDPICGMLVKEEASLKLFWAGENFYFCSKSCFDKFTKERKINNQEITVCPIIPRVPFYKNKTFIVALILIGASLLSYLVPILIPLRKSLIIYFKTIWWAILLGLVLGGTMEHYVPKEYITHILSKPKKRTIFYSVILGFFMSVCSHGILALSIELHKKGASNPAVVSFLLASPWANLILTVLLVGFFGLKAFFIIFSAIVIAIITGFIFQFLERKNLIETNKNTIEVEDNFSIVNDMKRRFKAREWSFEGFKKDIKGISNGIVSLSNMVLWWVLIGTGLAALFGAYIPTDIFTNYMGPTIFGLLITLLVATVIEVCSEGSAPIAFEIFRQTGALGNSFVFLMAGVVTDYTEIGLLWHNVGKRVAIWLPIVTVPQVIILGIIANKLF
ncbi:MAG: permease [Candidatus Omnitrophica bacterium]|nr:permease [Candidatus Omnitrophota bacterium]